MDLVQHDLVPLQGVLVNSLLEHLLQGQQLLVLLEEVVDGRDQHFGCFLEVAVGDALITVLETLDVED